ncbi:MAG: hypothetical protein HYY21_08845 [Candidatus Tectomicrobia bacterium]|nr:hypothetical protein [Candidatus Tectomicrobia bacterium]
MPRLNFTLDDEAVRLLDRLAQKYYEGNKSLTVRRALESLAVHAGHEGWRIAGYTPVVIEGRAACHTCGEPHRKGDVLYRPVFERGEGPNALATLPKESWLDCPRCVEQTAL